MRFAALWDRFWFGPMDARRAAVYRILTMLVALYAVSVFAQGVLQHAAHMEGLSLAQRTWRPVFLFELLGVDPPYLSTAVTLGTILVVAILFALIGLFTGPACLVAAVLGTWWMALHYSYGKPHHDCIALTFALWALPFGRYGARYSLDAWIARKPKPRTDVVSAFPIRVAQVSIALGYTFAGCTKLALGGLEWMNGYSLQAVLLEFDAPWTAYLTQRVWLCQALSIYSVLLQGTFLCALLPRLGWVYALLALGFHTGTWMTMDTGPYLTLSYVVLAAFLPWDQLPALARLRPPLLGWSASVGAVLLATWLGWIYARSIPLPTWIFDS